MFLGALCVSASAAPQAAGPSSTQLESFDTRLDRWRARHGRTWHAVYEPETGYARFLYGGNAPAPFVPAQDEQYFTLARLALEDAQEMHGVAPATLVDDTVTFLPLGIAGSTDKMTVQLRQRVNGVPVVHGFVNVLMDMQGRLLSIDATGLPGLYDLSTTPDVDARQASSIAVARFEDDAQQPVTRAGEPELVVDQLVEAGTRRPRLAWLVEVYSLLDGSDPRGFAYLVDARDGTILRREARVHSFDVSGTVRTLATPGLLPDVAGNAETHQAVPHVKIDYFIGNVTSDSLAYFYVPFLPFPLNVVVRYEGPRCKTINAAGTTHAHSQTLNQASANDIFMNQGGGAQTTAEANAFQWVNALWDWIHAVNPNDAIAEFQAPARVNMSFSCNAFYVGSEVQFGVPGPCPGGGNAVNTAYSTVVLHEMGHWWNDKYSSGNGPDGFGEGNADAFALYMTDQPILGQDFFGPGSNVRTGLNTRQYWGDASACAFLDGNGNVSPHACGEVLMGALWKVRTRLKNTYGASNGSAIANVLFNSWMNTFNDTEIKSIIETHWLVLDDTDGNLANGTPHFLEIDLGFRDQGFPGFGLQLATAHVNAANTTPPWLGTALDPFQRVMHGVQNVAPGGSVQIAAGNYLESPLTIDKQTTLKSVGGTTILR